MSKTKFETLDTHTLADVNGGAVRARRAQSEFARGFQQLTDPNRWFQITANAGN